jgi:REase_DpnII-MboI
MELFSPPTRLALSGKRAVVVTDSDDEPSGAMIAKMLGYVVDILRRPSVEAIMRRTPDWIIIDWAPNKVDENTALVEAICSVAAIRTIPMCILYSDARDVPKSVLAVDRVFALQIPTDSGVVERALRRATGDEPPGPSSRSEPETGTTADRSHLAIASVTVDAAQRSLPAEAWLLGRVRAVCEHFKEIAAPLVHRRSGKTSLTIIDEYDVQDLLNVMLRSISDNVRAEEPGPSFAGAGSLSDFYLPTIETIVETKRVRDGHHGRRGVADELIADRVRYAAHPACVRLICLVFDPDHHIRNVSVFKSDLEKQEGRPSVEVYVIR